MSKAGLHPKKAMLCIWWDWKGVFYYESSFWTPNNSNKHCSQLHQLKATLDEKCLELASLENAVFHQHDINLHVSLMIQAKELQLDGKF